MAQSAGGCRDSPLRTRGGCRTGQGGQAVVQGLHGRVVPGNLVAPRQEELQAYERFLLS
jgi:hypothetical protein